MMMWSVDFIAAVVYFAAALLWIFRAGYLQWFWCSVALWLAAGILGSHLLPGMWGVGHAGPLFVPHLYLTLGSVFFFVNWKRVAKGRFAYDSATKSGEYLGLFAVSNLLMTLSAALTGWLAWHSPVWPFFFPAWLEFYALQPLYWLAIQSVLAAVFYVHRQTVMRQPLSQFSGKQLFAGYLMVWLIQCWQILALAAARG
ncbi:hypothetical protein L4H06_07195 [Neisseria sp. ZJ104]|uniref:Integral membrane protein n=2 Tax=Neisseria lisongii TaxID=2912188 RepID=A0AAW5AKA7_9NEIS|nr:hypothetical protein [Neisseria lisongii]MCF7530006.1 hypothetical protein [Neisseria lisongii]